MNVGPSSAGALLPQRSCIPRPNQRSVISPSLFSYIERLSRDGFFQLGFNDTVWDPSLVVPSCGGVMWRDMVPYGGPSLTESSRRDHHCETASNIPTTYDYIQEVSIVPLVVQQLLTTTRLLRQMTLGQLQALSRYHRYAQCSSKFGKEVHKPHI